MAQWPIYAATHRILPSYHDPSSHHRSASLEILSRQGPDVSLHQFHGEYEDAPPRPPVEFFGDMQGNTLVENSSDWAEIPRSNASSSFEYHGQREESVSTRGYEPLVGHALASPAGKLMQFFHEFQHLYDLRNSAQTLRLRTRDERNKVKSSTRRLQDITRRLIREIKLQHDVTADLQALEEVIEEMDAQYINHDMYESDLIPAEWKLKEAEKNLYGDLTGKPFLDPAWSESDGRSSPNILPQLPSYGITMITAENPHQLHGQLEGAVADLKASEQETTLQLERLKIEYDEITEDANMHSGVGMPTTALTQDFLSGYAQRRGRLLDKLVMISEEIRALESQSSAFGRPKSPTADSLPLDQFSDRETDVLLRTYEDNGDDTLQLRAEDYGAREDDLNPVLDRITFTRANDGAGILPMSLGAMGTGSYPHSVSTEEPFDSSVITVSKWLFNCFTTSWWSAVRFAFEHYLDNTFSYVAIKRYMTDGWFKEVGLPLSNQPYGSELKSVYTYWWPETSNSSPARVDPPVRSLGQHRSPQKRRHSSGDSRSVRPKTHVIHSNRPNTL
ncbi:hypothetical protein RBB50_011559 [Rhinocladiella similis]